MPRLLNHTTGQIIRVGDRVWSRDNKSNYPPEEYEVIGWQEPHKSSSSGFIIVREIEPPTYMQEFPPSVFNCEWIERTDR